MQRVYITRGVPGVGKSAWIREHLVSAEVMSTTAALRARGAPCADRLSALSQAHADCLRAYAQAIIDGAPLIAVEIVGASLLDVAPYAALGRAYSAEVTIVQFQNRPGDRAWVRSCARASSYGVSIEQIERAAWRLHREASLPRTWRARVIDPGGGS